MLSRSARERHARFLDHGFFAPELPPCFSSQGLGALGGMLVKDIKELPKVRGRPMYQRYVSDKATFYFPRFNNSDRLHSVINPISYTLISELISRKYSNLRTLENRSRYSLSHSVFDWRGQRALRRPPFEKRDDFTSQLSPRFEYTVTADIRAFYHSIYTHSIAWAIHGKTIAKTKRGLDLYGNELDLLVRNAQGGQTIGLPVGPDTSRIMAEVVASSIDVAINRHLRLTNGDASRFVDDFTFGCNSIAEGQRIIAEVRRAVASFELDIGRDKTKIDPTNHLTYVGWKEYMREFQPKDASKESFERFFYVVHDMTKRHHALNVEKFAMQICRSAFLKSDDRKFLQEHIVSSYRKNSTLIDSMVEALLLRQHAKGDVDLSALADFISSRLPVLATQQRSGEAIWLLFLCCRLQIKMKASILVPFLRDPNPLIATLVAQAEDSGLVVGRIDRTYWNSFATAEGLRSEMWPYSYEAAGKNWHKGPRNYCANDKFYGLFLDRKIGFFNIELGYNDLDSVLRERRRENFLTKYLNVREEGMDGIGEDDFDDADFEDLEAHDHFDAY